MLAPHGSICVELGDTYSGTSPSGWDRLGARGEQDDQPPNYRKNGTVSWSGTASHGPGWPLAKSLCGIPHLYHLSLAYGRNLLTGEPCEPWRVRNVVAWCRPNPPVGALGDKFRPATSYLTIACPSAKRYFDLDAVRTPGASFNRPEGPNGTGRKTEERRAADGGGYAGIGKLEHNPAGAPPLDWWEIPTTPYLGSHYAVYPPALLERPIKAMVPQRVCTVGGEPSRRIGEAVEQEGRPVSTTGGDRAERAGRATTQQATGKHLACAENTTTGWTDCGHNAWRNGLVLDPFGGSGTTGMVATGNGRDALLIDIDERNVHLASDRIGMFLTHYTLDQWRKEQAA